MVVMGVSEKVLDQTATYNHPAMLFISFRLLLLLLGNAK